MEINNLAELQSNLESKKIVIYGAGYVADRFYQALKEHKLDTNVVCFVTSTSCANRKSEIPTIEIKQLEKDANILVCIAVHESIKDEIIKTLVARDFHNYIWIYPFLYELMLGAPLQKGVKVPLERIWNVCRENYAMAVRYLAIDHYYGKNENGYEIYIRAMSLFSDEDSSKKRLNQFIELIKNWEQNGYDIKQCASIFEDYRVFDGAHRIAVASYFNQGYVMCDIYAMKKSISEIHNMAAILPKQCAMDAGFEPEIVALLDATNKRIEEQYR